MRGPVSGSDGPLVAVTGASGFIAEHTIVALLAKGYRVRGTLRSMAREDGLRRMFADHASIEGRLEFVEADLDADARWEHAMAGCSYVMHIASPFPKEDPSDEQDLIRPAREGALRVLRAASSAGVSRVVMTSSLAAVIYGHGGPGHVCDESHWSDPDKDIGAYPKSKTLAERAAWELLPQLPAARRPQLVVINPGLVLGPVLEADTSTSVEVVRKLLARELPGCPRLGWSLVDVRDVAGAHIAAMECPRAAGKRYCCATEHMWLKEMAAIISVGVSGRGYRVPTRGLPDILMRAVALFDKTARMAVRSLGKREDVSTERIRSELAWRPMAAAKTLIDTAESLIARGVV